MMKIHVQNCKTQEFLDEAGQWTRDEHRAKTFRSTMTAYEHCTKYNIPHSQILLHFGRPDLDMTLPVSDSCR